MAATPDNTKLFATTDLDLATYLMAEDLLIYSHAAGQFGGERVAFYFHDTDDEGQHLQAQFSKRSPKCDLKTVVRCRDVLRAELRKAGTGGR